MKRKQPTISVIVLTCDRPQLLDAALASLDGQTVQPLECIVVDDSSHAAKQTRAVITGHSKLTPIVKRNTYHTISYGRHIGAEASRGDIIVYLDDDCEADSMYLSRFRDHFRTNPSLAAVMGRIQNANPDNLCASVQYAYYERGLRQFFPTLQSAELLTDGRILDAEVMGIQKTVLKRFGFSDLRNPTKNDDVALGLKLIRAGKGVLFDPAITARAHPRATLSSLWQAAFWNGYADAGTMRTYRINLRTSPYPSVYPAWFVATVRANRRLGFWKTCAFALLLLSFPIVSRMGKAWYYLTTGL